MPILTLLVVLIMIGVLLWAVTTYIPMAPGIKTLITIVGVVFAVIYVLNTFGIIGGLAHLRVPTLR